MITATTTKRTCYIRFNQADKSLAASRVPLFAPCLHICAIRRGHTLSFCAFSFFFSFFSGHKTSKLMAKCVIRCHFSPQSHRSFPRQLVWRMPEPSAKTKICPFFQFTASSDVTKSKWKEKWGTSWVPFTCGLCVVFFCRCIQGHTGSALLLHLTFLPESSP